MVKLNEGIKTRELIFFEYLKDIKLVEPIKRNVNFITREKIKEGIE